MTVLRLINAEFRGYLRAPVAYVLGALFLAVQGLAFAAQVAAMTDPAAPAPLGELLAGYFAGSLLTWVLAAAVIALLALRAVAEERRAGTWELLLTAGVTERQAIVAKWAAASAFYVTLWLPTIAYVVVAVHFRTPGTEWELSPLLLAYLGVMAVGALLIAVAIAAGAVSSSILPSGAASFAALLLLIIAGDVATLWPSSPGSSWAAVTRWLDAVSLRARVESLARGELNGATIVLFVGGVVTSLSAAVTVVARGQRRRDVTQRRAVATCLFAISSIALLVVAERHPLSFDVTARSENSLSAVTVAALHDLDESVEIVVVQPTWANLRPVYERVWRVLDKMTMTQPRVTVRAVDPTQDSAALAQWAQRAGVAPTELAGSGAIVVRAGQRIRVIDLLSFADVGRDAVKAAAITKLDVETPMVHALHDVTTATPWTLCMAEGDGETSASDDLNLVLAHLAEDGVRIGELDLNSSGFTSDAIIAAKCTVIAVIDPMIPMSPAAQLAIAEWVENGNDGLFVVPARHAHVGLESWLASAYGIEITPDGATDASAAVGGGGASQAEHFRVVDGYSAHPINAGFAHRRVTVWSAPRVLNVHAPAVPLLSTTKNGAPLIDEKTAMPDPHPTSALTFAAASERHAVRVVVVGGATWESSLEGNAATAWVENALRWTAHRDVEVVAIADKTPRAARLIMTVSERHWVVALCAGAIPILFALVGALIAWRRQRKRDADNDDARGDV